jgi:hypothetical protein
MKIKWGCSILRMPATAANRVLEVNTQRLRPSQALKPLYAIGFGTPKEQNFRK